MTRQEILQAIAVLDKQINEVAGSGRVASISNRRFPAGNWIAGIFFAAAWMFGGQIPPLAELHRQWAFVILVVAALILLSALLMTIRWVMKPGLGANKGLADSMEKVRGLQLQRQELQRRLAEIDKKI
ncbi:hypothetical protein GC173_08720 [bacterium]|nr:hypothetical protein [bacterium]